MLCILYLIRYEPFVHYYPLFSVGLVMQLLYI